MSPYGLQDNVCVNTYLTVITVNDISAKHLLPCASLLFCKMHVLINTCPNECWECYSFPLCLLGISLSVIRYSVGFLWVSKRKKRSHGREWSQRSQTAWKAFFSDWNGNHPDKGEDIMRRQHDVPSLRLSDHWDNDTPPPQRMGGFPGVSCWGPGGSQIEDSSPVEISHSGDNFSDHPVGDTEGKTKMPGSTIPWPGLPSYTWFFASI